VLLELYRFVDELTSSDDYTPACALRVSMTLTTVIPPEQTEEASPSDHAEEVDQVSLNEDLGLEVENDANFFYGESSSSQPGQGVPFYELPHLRYEHDVNFSYGEASSSQLGGFVPFHGLPAMSRILTFFTDKHLHISLKKFYSTGCHAMSTTSIIKLRKRFILSLNKFCKLHSMRPILPG